MPGYIASRNYGMVYLNMPKAACTTLKNYIFFLDYKRYYPVPLDIHKYSDELLLTFDSNKSELYEKFKSSIVFTFVRHPMRRAYSFFNEKILHDSKYAFKDVRGVLVDRYGADFSSDENIEVIRDNFIKFLKFVKDVKENRIQFRKDFHWMPQAYILSEHLESGRSILSEESNFSTGISGMYWRILGILSILISGNSMRARPAKQRMSRSSVTVSRSWDTRFMRGTLIISPTRLSKRNAQRRINYRWTDMGAAR